MAGKKERTLVPSYSLSAQEFYLLLRLVMGITGKKNVNGLQKQFFEASVSEKKEKTLKSLSKKDIIGQQGDGIMLHDGIRRALDAVLDSSYCLSFQNALLKDRNQLLSVYYANGIFTALLQDRREVRLVYSPDAEAIYEAFRKIIEASGVSRDFQAEAWRALTSKEAGDTVDAPVREAMIVHSANRLARERFTVALVADRKRLQIVRAKDGAGREALEKELIPASMWYGAVMRELERLRREHGQKNGEKQEKSGGEAPQSEYRRIVSSPSFPRSGPAFVIWCMKRIITGLPRLCVQTVRKKCLAPLWYVLWAALLFFYNMYITCYFNDTFMLDRQSRWGNLTPYLMGGTLQTPSKLKGFDVSWGLIDTTFLVFPLMLLLTVTGRHLLLQIKRRKILFVADLFSIPSRFAECRGCGYGGKRQFWIVFAVVCGFGFLLMNPVTLFLAAVFSMLIFAQGRENGMVQFSMLWACACGRRRIEEGKRPEPRSEKFLIPFFYIGAAFFVYGGVSLALWFAADYNFWIRLAATLLLIAFSLLRIFRQGLISDRAAARTVRTTALILAVGAAAAYFGGRYGVVLADDGGWTESGGTLSGLLANAGFGTILGISLLTIGLALGGPLAWVVGGSCILGVGTFLTGLTETAAGEYVRKSSHQYFFGPDKGESKTLLCGLTELAGFISGFLNPAQGAGAAATSIFYGGKLAGDAVSIIGDAASTLEDVKNFAEGTGDVSAGDLLWDVLGLSLDICGIKDDIGETAEILDDIKLKGDSFAFDKGQGLISRLKELNENQNNELAQARTDIDFQRQSSLDAENIRHREQLDSIQKSISDTNSGAVTPPANMDKNAYIEELNCSARMEESIYNENLSRIDEQYAGALSRKESEIMDKYAELKKDPLEELITSGIDNGYSIKDEADSVYEDIKAYFEKKAGE